MGVKITGLNNLRSKLNQIANAAQELDGQKQIPLSELLTDDFIRKNTSFTNVDDLFSKSGYKVESKEDFEAIPEDEFNEFIKNNTDFNNWKEMLEVALKVYVSNKLGL